MRSTRTRTVCGGSDSLCGALANRRAVIGGTSDTSNHYANVGVLQLHIGNDWFDFCSGRWRADVVLTAAHCTDFLQTSAGRPRPCRSADRSIPRGRPVFDVITSSWSAWFTAGTRIGNRSSCSDPRTDIAPVFLDAPVAGIAPAPIADPAISTGLT